MKLPRLLISINCNHFNNNAFLVTNKNTDGLHDAITVPSSDYAMSDRMFQECSRTYMYNTCVHSPDEFGKKMSYCSAMTISQHRNLKMHFAIYTTETVVT